MGYLHIDNLYKNQTIRLFRECYALEKVLASIQAERDELRSACDKQRQKCDSKSRTSGSCGSNVTTCLPSWWQRDEEALARMIVAMETASALFATRDGHDLITASSHRRRLVDAVC